MILWDRVKKNMDEGIAIVRDVSRKLSERARIEAAVARLLIDKGSLETKKDRAARRLGERVFELSEHKSSDVMPDVMKDADVIDTLKEISDIKERIDAIGLNIQRASLGEEE